MEQKFRLRHCSQAIAEALEATHEIGIIHRDLKPANIKLYSGPSTQPSAARLAAERLADRSTLTAL